ncbi:MAG: hypothetical protein AAFV53_20625 [Myxococcota bacterium]
MVTPTLQDTADAVSSLAAGQRAWFWASPASAQVWKLFLPSPDSPQHNALKAGMPVYLEQN